MNGRAMRALTILLVVALVCANIGTATFSPSAPLRRDAPTLSLHRAANPQLVHRRSAGIGQVTLTTDHLSYYTLIAVGGVNFRVALDTASSDLWILASSCNAAACKAVPTYPLSYKSPTFIPVNANTTLFNVSFADGTGANGFIARESVQLLNFTVPDQVFGLAQNVSVKLNNEVSGVLGLGFPRLSTFASLSANVTPFVDFLAQTGRLDYPMFGVSLTRNDTGSLTFGAVDINVVHNASNIEWHPVVSFSPFGIETNTSRYLQWSIQLSNITVNGTVVELQPTFPNITEASLALLDVGTNGIFGPYQDVSRIFELMPASRLVDAQAGLWAVPCDTNETLSFSFGRRQFTLQPTDYLIGPATGNPNLCLSWPQAAPPSPDGIDWQLGTPFLRTVYSVFSFGIDTKEPPMIGLYAIQNATSLTETTVNVSSFFSSASATIATTLPNFPLSTVTPTPVSYIFNTSVPALVGQVVSSDLGTSTYSPVLAAASINASALPTISPSATLFTLVLTDASGAVQTLLSHAPTPSIKLGKPPGSGAATLHSLSHACVLALGLGFTALFVLL